MADDYGIGQRDSLQVHGGCGHRGGRRGALMPCRPGAVPPGGAGQAALTLVRVLTHPGPHLTPLTQDAVEAVGRILGMQACEGTDAVPPNARSHTLLLAGTVVGDVQVLVRLAFGIDAGRNVAMKLVVRSESAEVSEAIHHIIQQS